ncbi:MAG: hypothetical protein WCF61_12650 [Terriglobales bacterium]
MTIAAAFAIADGIVLCADTQEVIPGYTKNKTTKIRESLTFDNTFGLLMVGAGDTDLIEAAMQTIEQVVEAEHDQNFSVERVRPKIETAFRSFFNNNIAPYAGFPRDDRPAVELLIAVHDDRRNYVFKAAGATVREVEEWTADCIGSGTLLARNLIDRFYDPGMGLDELVIAACYIMSQIEKYDVNCGGPTDLYVSSHKHNVFCRIPPAALEEAESLFGHFDARAADLLRCFPNPNVSNEKFDQTFRHIQDWMTKLRQGLLSSESSLRYYLDRLGSKPQPSPAESGQK